MIRILHYIGSLGSGGSQAMIMNLYRNIDRSKIQFDYVIEDRKNLFYNKEAEKLGAKIFYCPDYNGKNHFEFVKWWNNFFKNHPEYRIFHCHIRSTSYICIKLAKKYGLTAIPHSHSTSNGTGVYGIIKNIMQYPTRYISDYYFACSKEAGEWMFGKKAASSNRFHVIKNSIETEKYKYNAEKREKMRNELGVSDRFVIGHIGRFMEAKNHDFLIDVFKEVHDSKPESILMLVGEGPLKKQIEQKVSRAGLQKNVMFLGIRNDVPNLIQAMDVFAFPSIYEGLPVALVESQAGGLKTFCSSAMTKEVLITDLIIPLKLDINTWVKNILKEANNARSQEFPYESIKKNGFDVSISSSNLSKFYLNLNDKILRREKHE